MPEPLLMPPSSTLVSPINSSHATVLLTVSVVMIASEAFFPPSSVSERASAAFLIPGTITSIGIGCPITPVDAVKTDSGLIFRSSATLSAKTLLSLTPCSPMQAFAIPLFKITACFGCPFLSSSMSHFTGAAFTRFVVNVAPATQGASLYTSAMSFLFFLRIPASMPLALKTCGVVTLPLNFLMILFLSASFFIHAKCIKFRCIT